MNGLGTDLDAQLAEMRKDIEDLKQAFSSSTPSDSLPLVELLLKDNARRREAEDKLAQAQAWMHLAQEHGGVANYQYDVAGDQLFWSASTYGLYGLRPGRDRATLETWMAAIHPEDRERVVATAQAAIEVGAAVDQEFRILLPEGAIRWIKDRGRVEVDVDGRPQRVLGVNIDITDLKLTQAALAESEAQFRHTFEHAGVGVAHVGLDGSFLRVNRYLCDLLGRRPDELMATTFHEVTYPDDLASDLVNFRRILCGEIDHYAMEKRYVRKGGEVVWADLSVSLRRQPDGTPANFISVIVDTRQKKVAEERLRLILGEISHRSKNSLAVLESVIQLSSTDAKTTDELRSALIERVRGMAASQELLTEKETETASLRQLVEKQMAVCLPRGSPRLNLEGPAVQLRSEAAYAIGLAIHELATNACKYGALSSDQGRIFVAWQVRRDGDLLLAWNEKGGPAVSPPTRTGFGSRVFERLVEASLGASAKTEYRPEGLSWLLRVPAQCLA